MTHAIVEAICQVGAERDRQESLKAGGKFTYGPADAELSDVELMSVLGEEVGEANHEVNETIGHPERVTLAQRIRLRDELVQVAAVAVGRVELLNRQIAGWCVPEGYGLVLRCDNMRSSTFWDVFKTEAEAWQAVDARMDLYRDEYYVLPVSECPRYRVCTPPSSPDHGEADPDYQSHVDLFAVGPQGAD